MSELKELELQKAQYQQLVKIRDAIKRLEENPDFYEFIIEYYCTKECARYLGVSGDPALSVEDRALALEMAKGCQHFKRWLNVQIQLGDNAEEDLPRLDQALLQAAVEE